MVLRSILEVSAPEGTARRRWIRLVRRAMWSYRARGLWQTLAVIRNYLRLPRSSDPHYQQGIRERQPSTADLGAQQVWPRAAAQRRAIGVVVAVPAGGMAQLRDTLASVCAHTYPPRGPGRPDRAGPPPGA